MNLLWRGWRTLATVACFAVFALGGMILGVIGIPLVRLAWRRPQARHRAGRWLIQRGFLLFGLMMRGTGVLRVKYEGMEVMRASGRLVLANHPTLIDFVCDADRHRV